MSGFDRIGVIGGGAWGTALAATACAGGATLLWAREPEVAAAINRDHLNPVFLPDVPLPAALRATGDLAAAADADALLLVAPAQHLRAVCRALAPHVRRRTPLVICAKGIEETSGALMSEVAAAELGDAPLAVLSGPTFAAEVARGLPTAVTLAAAPALDGEALAARLGRPTFRPYLSDDLVGAQVGGAVKNVLAIACGMVEGLGLGHNARAALITRGMAEIVRLGRAKGARAETLMGLSGLGDLVLTCTSPQSRNYSLGRELGQGRRLAELLDGRRSVAEGVSTAAAVRALAARLGVEMPISAAVAAVLHDGAPIAAAAEGLLARPFTTESLV